MKSRKVVSLTDIDRILIVKLRAIGDVLLSTVVIKNLRLAYPGAEITFLTEKASREVVDGNSALSSLIVLDPATTTAAGLIFEIRRKRFDLVIDLFGNPRSALLTFLSGGRHRVGYRFGWRRFCYNLVVEPRGGKVHNTEFNLDALRAIGVPTSDSSPVFPVDDGANRFAEAFFSEQGLRGRAIIAINAGGGWYTKRWGLRRFAEIGRKLCDRYNAVVLILWGPGEREDAESIFSLMQSGGVVIPAATLKELAALLSRCTALVTNDSGPMHIAAAVGTPVLALFGPTNPELQGPVGERHEVVQNETLLCLGCNYTSCPIGNPCMEELSVEAVLAGFHRLAEKNQLFELARQP